MHAGELPTRVTIWLALAGYALGAGMLARARGRAGWMERARWAWTSGCALFLAHVVCAFGYYHGWSHAAAYRETARRTGELTGWPWGGGIFFNYVFGAIWLGDVLWWWTAPERFARRSPRLRASLQGFFFFMVFNGTVVFGRGLVRWYGLAICASLAALWRRSLALKQPS